MCSFFCQVWIVAKSFYFYFLSHCVRQTKNTDEDLKFFLKGHYCSVTSHSFDFSLVNEDVALLSKESATCHSEKLPRSK